VNATNKGGGEPCIAAALRNAQFEYLLNIPTCSRALAAGL
jgi:hypothetical protein